MQTKTHPSFDCSAQPERLVFMEAENPNQAETTQKEQSTNEMIEELKKELGDAKEIKKEHEKKVQEIFESFQNDQKKAGNKLRNEVGTFMMKVALKLEQGASGSANYKNYREIAKKDPKLRARLDATMNKVRDLLQPAKAEAEELQAKNIPTRKETDKAADVVRAEHKKEQAAKGKTEVKKESKKPKASKKVIQKEGTAKKAPPKKPDEKQPPPTPEAEETKEWKDMSDGEKKTEAKKKWDALKISLPPGVTLVPDDPVKIVGGTLQNGSARINLRYGDEHISVVFTNKEGKALSKSEIEGKINKVKERKEKTNKLEEAFKNLGVEITDKSIKHVDLSEVDDAKGVLVGLAYLPKEGNTKSNYVQVYLKKQADGTVKMTPKDGGELPKGLKIQDNKILFQRAAEPAASDQAPEKTKQTPKQAFEKLGLKKEKGLEVKPREIMEDGKILIRISEGKGYQDVLISAGGIEDTHEMNISNYEVKNGVIQRKEKPIPKPSAENNDAANKEKQRITELKSGVTAAKKMLESFGLTIEADGHAIYIPAGYSFQGTLWKEARRIDVADSKGDTKNLGIKFEMDGENTLNIIVREEAKNGKQFEKTYKLERPKSSPQKQAAEADRPKPSTAANTESEKAQGKLTLADSTFQDFNEYNLTAVKNQETKYNEAWISQLPSKQKAKALYQWAFCLRSLPQAQITDTLGTESRSDGGNAAYSASPPSIKLRMNNPREGDTEDWLKSLREAKAKVTESISLGGGKKPENLLKDIDETISRIQKGEARREQKETTTEKKADQPATSVKKETKAPEAAAPVDKRIAKILEAASISPKDVTGKQLSRLLKDFPQISEIYGPPEVRKTADGYYKVTLSIKAGTEPPFDTTITRRGRTAAKLEAVDAMRDKLEKRFGTPKRSTETSRNVDAIVDRLKLKGKWADYLKSALQANPNIEDVLSIKQKTAPDRYITVYITVSTLDGRSRQIVGTGTSRNAAFKIATTKLRPAPELKK